MTAVKDVLYKVGIGLIIGLIAVMTYIRFMDPGLVLKFLYTTRSSGGQENTTPFLWAVGGALIGGYIGALFGWLRARRKVNAKYANYWVQPSAYLVQNEIRAATALPAMLCLMAGMIMGAGFSWYFG